MHNKRYWKAVRKHLISQARASRDDAVLRLALDDDDWLFEAMNYAPAGKHITAAECAAIIVRNFLLAN